MELEQAIDKAVEAVGLQSLKPLQRHVISSFVTRNDVFVTLQVLRGLRAFQSSRLAPQALQVPSVRQKSTCVRARALVLLRITIFITVGCNRNHSR